MKNSVLTVWDQNNKVIFSKGLDSVTRYSDLNNSDQKSIDRFLAAFEQRTGGNKGTSSGWYDYYADVENDYDDHAKVYWKELPVSELPCGLISRRMRHGSVPRFMKSALAAVKKYRHAPMKKTGSWYHLRKLTEEAIM